MKLVVGPLLVSILIGSTAATAQSPGQSQPAPAPCSTPEFRQMDFWVGTWDVRWETGGGVTAGSGTNVITREYGGCVVQEQFDGGPGTGGLIGHSVSIYDAQAKRWRQTWVDNQGGYFALAGGPEGETFVLVSHRFADQVPQARMVFEEIEPNSLTWRWQRSTDGGATWTDSWVIFYQRRGA
jgi:hypothetical protein